MSRIHILSYRPIIAVAGTIVACAAMWGAFTHASDSSQREFERRCTEDLGGWYAMGTHPWEYDTCRDPFQLNRVVDHRKHW